MHYQFYLSEVYCRMRDRIRCVLLAAEDWTTVMIAKSQLIDETTVRRHLHDWLNGEKIKPENGDTTSDTLHR
ncbi:helix-turn-helix domain-containing protein [Buttiauxella ferragutiae]